MPNKKQKGQKPRIDNGDVQHVREFLGPLAGDYTSAELEQLGGEMRAMAEILIEFYLLKQRNGGDLPQIDF